MITLAEEKIISELPNFLKRNIKWGGAIFMISSQRLSD